MSGTLGSKYTHTDTWTLGTGERAGPVFRNKLGFRVSDLGFRV